MTLEAPDFASDWIAAFNEHDLERILSHYAQDVELISPLYQQFTSGRSDCVEGLDALRDYFGTALKHFPELHFTLLEVASGSRGLCVRYRTNLGNRVAIECFERDPGGAVTRVLCHYVSDMPVS